MHCSEGGKERNCKDKANFRAQYVTIGSNAIRSHVRQKEEQERL